MLQEDHTTGYNLSHGVTMTGRNLWTDTNKPNEPGECLTVDWVSYLPPLRSPHQEQGGFAQFVTRSGYQHASWGEEWA